MLPNFDACTLRVYKLNEKIISKCKNESKLARLRQRIRARQATPKCWPQKTDTKPYIKMKEAYISYIVGGDWFNKKNDN